MADIPDSQLQALAAATEEATSSLDIAFKGLVKEIQDLRVRIAALEEKAKLHGYQ
jgi:hypothetical protein